MTFAYAYDHCATCGHLGASHSPTGECMAQEKRGIAQGRGMVGCRCVAFVPPEPRRDPTTAGPLRLDSMGVPTREHPGMGPPR